MGESKQDSGCLIATCRVKKHVVMSERSCYSISGRIIGSTLQNSYIQKGKENDQYRQGTYYKRLLAGLAWVGLQTIFPVCLPLNNSFFLWKSGTFQRLNAFNEPQCCASAAAGVGNEARNNVAVRVPGCVSHCCGNAARTAACFTCRRWSSPLQNVFLLQFCSPAVITPVMCVCVHACVCVHVCVCYATSFLWKYNNLQNRRGTKEKWSSYFPSVVRSSPCCPLTAAGTEQPVKESLFGKAEGKDELT